MHDIIRQENKDKREVKREYKNTKKAKAKRLAQYSEDWSLFWKNGMDSKGFDAKRFRTETPESSE